MKTERNGGRKLAAELSLHGCWKGEEPQSAGSRGDKRVRRSESMSVEAGLGRAKPNAVNVNKDTRMMRREVSGCDACSFMFAV